MTMKRIWWLLPAVLSSSFALSEVGCGGGGGGASSTTGGHGGAGGSSCDPSACPAPSNECVDAICDGDGKCAEQPKPDGAVAATQAPGDCKAAVCQGGAVVTQTDDTDLPDDANDCTDDVCTEGTPSNPTRALDAPCGPGGTSFCDGAGTCAQCTAPAQCPGQDTECQTRTCTDGACGVDNAAQGTPTTAQTAGDCKKSQCDGAGAIELVADVDDIEDDGNPCTDDACADDAPVHTPAAVHTPCGAGLICDGAGTCVGCVTAADCQPPPNACLDAICVAGMCNVVNKPDGSACNDGNACTQIDTCQAGTCIAGSPVTCMPIDQCHNAGTCNPANGTCSTPNKPNGTPCVKNGQPGVCQFGNCL
jgi:hypothetical protein